MMSTAALKERVQEKEAANQGLTEQLDDHLRIIQGWIRLD